MGQKGRQHLFYKLLEISLQISEKAKNGKMENLRRFVISGAVVDAGEADVELLGDRVHNTGTETSRGLQRLQPTKNHQGQ